MSQTDFFLGLDVPGTVGLHMDPLMKSICVVLFGSLEGASVKEEMIIHG